MFRQTSRQSSFFEAENYFLDALPADDWSHTYRREILPLIDENKFRHFYSGSDGRANASIRTMVSLLIFMGMEKLTWRDAEFHFQRRTDWLSATETPLGKGHLDHTTLFKFYRRLEDDPTAGTLFIEITDSFVRLCGTSLKKQRTDSFFIHGWLRLLSRYGLFKETIRKFLQMVRKRQPELYETIKSQLSRDYFENEFDLTEKDSELVRKKIALMARDLYYLKCAFEQHPQLKQYETFQTLATVFSQHCDVSAGEGAAEISVKEKLDSPGICSPHNPEVQFARKGAQRIVGDKAVVTETCDPDNKTQFIVDVELVKAAEHDSKQTDAVQERLIANDFKPEQQYADAGFVNGKSILSSHDKGIQLEGPTAGHSQSFAEYHQKDRPLDAGDFTTTIDEGTQRLVITHCPNNQTPLKQLRGTKTDKIIAHFDRAVCTKCPYAQRCPVTFRRKVAVVRFSQAAYTGAVRHHHYMSNKAYRKECAIRAGAEAMVSELTRAHGMRKSRHRKTTRTRLQLIFAAMACNVKRFIRHGVLFGYLEPKVA